MPARNVSLTSYLAEFVDENVESGRFQNASEVVREGLRLLDQRQKEDVAKIERLRTAVRVGIDAAARGDEVEIEPGELHGFISGLGRTGAED